MIRKPKPAFIQHSVALASFVVLASVVTIAAVCPQAQASLPDSKTELKLPELSVGNRTEKSGSTATVGYDVVNYLYSSADRDNIFQSFQASGNLRSASRFFEAAASGQLKVMVTPTVQTYFELPELYLGTSPELSVARAAIGRKLETWNHLDDEWRLGIWQPRFRWDYLHPDLVGLTGGFLNVDLPLVKVVAFGSPIFIPERGVAITVSNGQFASPSPWFLSPNRKINLFDQDTPIDYSLEIPPIREIVLQPSMAVMARVGADQGPWISGAYAYKPMNQLLLGHDPFLQINDPIEVRATIRPRVVYHHLLSAEAGFQHRRFGVNVSAMHEQPVDNPSPSNWTVQQTTPAWVAGSSIHFSLGNLQEPSRIDLGYLRRIGGNAPDAGRDSNGTNSVFEPRYSFQNAFRVSGSTPLSAIFGQALRGLSTSSRLIYDVAEDGALWSTEFKFSPKENWALNLGSDLLATDVLNAPKLQENFITRYQVNNRVHAGISYVF